MANVLGVSIAVNRHYDHGNTYKENILMGWFPYSFRGSVHSGWVPWQHEDRYVAGAENATSCTWQEVEIVILGKLEQKRPQSPAQEWHICSNKATSTPTKPQPLIVPLCMRLWSQLHTNHYCKGCGSRELSFISGSGHWTGSLKMLDEHSNSEWKLLHICGKRIN